MKKPTVKYSKGEIGRVRIVEDFLPSPDRLVLREDNVKVTLSLSQRSVAFFKRAARQRRVPYQRMIRALVDGRGEECGSLKVFDFWDGLQIRAEVRAPFESSALGCSL
jgi:hypothetical protein